MTTIVTRNGQITIDKRIRDELGIEVGTPLEVNLEGERIVISKKDPAVWRRIGKFLPKDYEKILKRARVDNRKRLKRLGIIKNANN